MTYKHCILFHAKCQVDFSFPHGNEVIVNDDVTVLFPKIAGCLMLRLARCILLFLGCGRCSVSGNGRLWKTVSSSHRKKRIHDYGEHTRQKTRFLRNSGAIRRKSAFSSCLLSTNIVYLQHDLQHDRAGQFVPNLTTREINCVKKNDFWRQPNGYA